MKKHGKKYVAALTKLEKDKLYNVEEAIKLVKETSVTKFDSTIEVALNLNIDAKKSDQSLRGSFVLPNGTGKTKRILVISKGENVKKAQEAGATYAGEKEMIDKIANENWFDFDVIVATPDMMPELGKIGKVLGPKGLMPNPKTGTVTTDVVKAVSDINKGMIAYKNDSYGNIHTIIGKSSFDIEKLVENLKYVVTTVAKAKPASVKGVFINNITVTSTMGPGIKLDKNSFDI